MSKICVYCIGANPGIDRYLGCIGLVSNHGQQDQPACRWVFLAALPEIAQDVLVLFPTIRVQCNGSFDSWIVVWNLIYHAVLRH